MTKIKTLRKDKRLSVRKVRKLLKTFNKVYPTTENYKLIYLVTGATPFKGDITSDFIIDKTNKCKQFI